MVVGYYREVLGIVLVGGWCVLGGGWLIICQLAENLIAGVRFQVWLRKITKITKITSLVTQKFFQKVYVYLKLGI